MLRVKHQGDVVAEIPNRALTDEAPVYQRPMERPTYLDDVQALDLDVAGGRGRRRRTTPASAPRHRRPSRASAGSTASTTTWCRPTPSTCPGSAPASCASRARIARWRCRSTATGATAISIRSGARCSRWPKRRATSPAPARSRSAHDQLPQLRQPRAAGDHVAVRAGRCRASARPAGRSACRSPAATSASTTRPTASAIYPTPVIGVVGLLEHADRVLTRRFRAIRATSIVLLGEGRGELGGSEYLKAGARARARACRRRSISRRSERCRNCWSRSRTERLVRSAHDCSDGGSGGRARRVLLRHAAVSGPRSSIEGAYRSPPTPRLNDAAALFGESASRVVVSAAPDLRDRGACSGPPPPVCRRGSSAKRAATGCGWRWAVRWQSTSRSTTPSARGPGPRSNRSSRGKWPDMLDKFKDECGVFGIFGHPEAANMTYLGLYALQHRGQESAGIAASRRRRRFGCRRRWAMSPTSSTSETLARAAGARLAIGHVRYSTAGESQLVERAAVPHRLRARADRHLPQRQPGRTPTSCATELVDQGSIFQSSSDTEVVLHLYARSKAAHRRGRDRRLGDAGAGRVLVPDDDQRSADRGPRSARLPAAGARPARRRVRRLLGDLRDGSDRRDLRARRRAGRSC